MEIAFESLIYLNIPELRQNNLNTIQGLRTALVNALDLEQSDDTGIKFQTEYIHEIIGLLEALIINDNEEEIPNDVRGALNLIKNQETQQLEYHDEDVTPEDKSLNANREQIIKKYMNVFKTPKEIWADSPLVNALFDLINKYSEPQNKYTFIIVIYTPDEAVDLDIPLEAPRGNEKFKWLQLTKRDPSKDLYLNRAEIEQLKTNNYEDTIILIKSNKKTGDGSHYNPLIIPIKQE